MRQFALMFAAVALVVALAVPAQASIIAWTNQWVANGVETTMYASLSTTGALLDGQAQNLGSTTVQTKDTGHGTIAFAADATSGTGYNRLGGAGGPHFNSADDLLNSADWGLTTAGTLVLSGLTSGQDYLVQLLSVDNRGANAGKTLSVDSGPSVTYCSSTGGYWLFTGTFTADAGTQTIGLLNSTGNPQVNAYQVRVIPEPGTIALLVAGLVGLLCYAWRKRK